MKNKAIKIGIIASVLPHIFCCGLPVALSLIGLIAPEFAHTSLIPEWIEPWIFVVGAGALGLSWVMVVRDCRCACNHCHGENNHHTQKIILGAITLLFIVSVILHLTASH